MYVEPWQEVEGGIIHNQDQAKQEFHSPQAVLHHPDAENWGFLEMDYFEDTDNAITEQRKAHKWEKAN